MVTEIPRSTLLGLPRIFFAGGLWRHVPMPPYGRMGATFALNRFNASLRMTANIKAGEYCNEMNRVGRDKLQP